MTEEIKRGSRHSSGDRADMQALHDISVRQGAQCMEKKSGDMEGGADEGEMKALAPEYVFVGSEIKALDDNGKVGGYLVRFSDGDTPDLTGDYFTKDTDFGEMSRLPVLYQHGFDKKMGKRKIGSATIQADDVGIWAESQLSMRDEYERMIFEMAKTGKLGYSSGAASHTVERVHDGKAAWIKQWYMAEASLTPTPAEPRNTVQTIKSLLPSDEGIAPKGEDVKKHLEGNTMEEKDIKAMLDESNKTLVELVENKAEAAATKAVEAVLDKLPEVKAAFGAPVQVVKDEADQPFKSDGEYFTAVKNAAIMPAALDPRLRGLKATGLSEAQPSQAGFLVPQQTAAGIIQRMYGTGSLLSLFSNRDAVSGNNMTYNVVDETSRADGSRMGGIQGYWLNEGGTKTASKPTFRQLELKLKKVAALCVATDELLEDAPALASWLGREVPNELRFKVEDAIVNGDGVGKPFGFLSSPAYKSVTRTDANEIDAFDLGRMWAGRWAGVNDYVWFGNQSIFPQLLNLTIGQMPVFIPAGGLSGLPYATLLGRPYYDIEYAPTLGTLGDLSLVSPSQYQMIEKSGGIQSAASIHVYFTTDESAFRFVYRVDGAPIWNSTLTGKDANTYSPFVGLAAST